MGCDIHMVLERNIGGEWVGQHAYHGIETKAVDVYNLDDGQQPPIRSWVNYKITSRNYTLFGELAGVRRDSSLGNEPRGLPDNMSQLTRVASVEWGDDGHSHSHLSLREFAAAYCAAYDQTPQLVEHRLSPTKETTAWFHDTCEIITGMSVYHENIDDFRICFWFDN